MTNAGSLEEHRPTTSEHYVNSEHYMSTIRTLCENYVDTM